jgi:hypothetical protein
VSTTVPGWPEAFRGSLAVAGGLSTSGRLRGPRFVRLYPDVYCPAADEPPDLRLRLLLHFAAHYRGGTGTPRLSTVLATPTRTPARRWSRACG